jgi:hypothetical protein
MERGDPVPINKDKRGGSICGKPMCVALGMRELPGNVADQPFPFWICRRQDPCGSCTSQAAGGPGPKC